MYMKVNKSMRRSIQFLAQIQTGSSHNERNEGSLFHATGRLAWRSRDPFNVAVERVG